MDNETMVVQDDLESLIEADDEDAVAIAAPTQAATIC
jgi:hypothetical protein